MKKNNELYSFDVLRECSWTAQVGPMKLIILSFCCYRTIAHRAKIDQNVSLHYSRYEIKWFEKVLEISWWILAYCVMLVGSTQQKHWPTVNWGLLFLSRPCFLSCIPISIENMLQSTFFHVCGKEPQPGHIRDLISNYYTAVILLRAKIWEKRRSQHPTGEPEHQVMTPSLKKSLDCWARLGLNKQGRTGGKVTQHQTSK